MTLFCLFLCSINLTIEEGSLVAIVGAVGAGKSSLLAAMLGEMEKEAGSVSVKVCTAQFETRMMKVPQHRLKTSDPLVPSALPLDHHAPSTCASTFIEFKIEKPYFV